MLNRHEKKPMELPFQGDRLFLFHWEARLKVQSYRVFPLRRRQEAPAEIPSTGRR
jgi:hypothetical protein